MNILHLSDIQPGKTGPEQDKDLKEIDKETIFDNLISDFNLYFNKINQDNEIDIVIVSGDLSSTSDISEYEKTRKMLKVIIDKNIPILPAPGNHDLKFLKQKKWKIWKRRKNEDKFQHYSDFITSIIDTNYKYFREMQFGYYERKDIEILFIFINSNLYISNKKRNFVRIDITYIDNIFKQIISDIGESIFNKYHKILISHHGWRKLDYSFGLSSNLERYGFMAILSGHEHSFNYDSCEGRRFINIQAGSILTSNISRIVKHGTIDLEPRQFNLYKVQRGINSMTFQIEQHLLSEGEWIIGETYKKHFTFLDGNEMFTNLPEFLKNELVMNYRLLQSKIPLKLANQKIFIDFSGYDNKEILNYIFILSKIDSQNKFKKINKTYRYFKDDPQILIKVILLEEINTSLLTLPDSLIEKKFLI